MDSLNSIRPLVMNYIRDTKDLLYASEEVLHYSDKLREKEFLQTVHNTFFNVFTDSSHSPEDLINLLERYTSGLEGFSKNPFIQAVIAYACVEAIATRISGVLKEQWETLLWILVKYSSFSYTSNGGDETTFKKPNKATLKFIIQYGSKELCPNPYLRLEILRFMRSFNTYGWFRKDNCVCELNNDNKCSKYRHMFKNSYNVESHCKNIINTLVDLSNDNTPFTIGNLPNFSPRDLADIMDDNCINMGYIIRKFESKMEISKFILSFLMLLRKFAILEKEKHIGSVYRLWEAGLKTQLSYCITLCTISSFKDEHVYPLAQLIENDSFLQNYLIDTIIIMCDALKCLSDDDGIVWCNYLSVRKVFYSIVRKHIKKISKFRNIYEINGGITPAAEFRLRFFQELF